MNRNFHFVFTVLAVFLFIQAVSQEQVKIVDPNLTFSYLMPEGWTNTDDPYYHYIAPPCASKGLEITYYDGRCKVIEDCFEAETKGAFPKKYESFRVDDSGTLKVGETPSPWIAFTFSDEEGKKMGFYTTFIKLNQQFTFLFIDEKKCFKTEKENIVSLIEDFRVKSN